MNVGGGRAPGETLLDLRTSGAALEAVETQASRTVAIEANES